MGLYRDWASWALGARVAGRCDTAWGGQEGARADAPGARQERAGRTVGALGTHSRGARGARLGVLLGCRLCTWCTQPVFDTV